MHFRIIPLLATMAIAVLGCGNTERGSDGAPNAATAAATGEPSLPVVAKAQQTELPGAMRKPLVDFFYGVRFGEYDVPATLPAATRANVTITLTNDGDSTWEARQEVGLAYHWFSATGELVALNGQRTELPKDVTPGETVTMSAGLEMPSLPGKYILTWDLARQGISWFGAQGGDTLNLAIDVLPNQDQYIGSAAMEHTHTRLLLIGIDGGDWNYFDPLIKAGRLPNLSKLIDRGVRADLTSLKDFSASPVIWTTIATGRTPEEHGVIDFTIYEEDTHRTVPVNSTFRRAPAFWDLLSHNKISSAVVGWWATWPATPTYGLMVSDRFAMYPQVERAAYPPMLKQELVSTGIINPDHHSPRIEGSLGRHVDLDTGEANPALHPRLQMNISQGWQYYEHDRTYLGTSLYLIEKYHPEMFATYFRGVDALQHFFWQYLEPEKFLVPEEELKQFRDILPAYAEYVDEGIGRLIEAVPADTTVLIVSDHGAQAASGDPTIITTNHFLEKLGFLTFDETNNGKVDFSKTRAFVDITRGDVVGIRVNLQGREPQGIVPPDDLSTVIAEIKYRIESLKIIGDAPVQSPLRATDGKDDAWDVMYAWNSYREIRDTTQFALPSQAPFEMGEIAILQYRTGMHRREGIFLLAGPGVRKSARLDHASVFDVLPTINFIMNSPTPDDLRGRILKGAFTDDFLASQPERYFAADDDMYPNSQAPAPEGETDSFDKQILQDLRALGYIE